MPLNKSLSFLASTAIAALLAASSVAQANPITIFNTGVDASQNVLGDGAIGDLHYTLVSAPDESATEIRVRKEAGGYPIPPYNGDDLLSAWIGPNNDDALNSPTGQYDYRTTFDLSGFDPASASLIGQWSSDNKGLGIALNGVMTTVAQTSSGAFSSFHQFSINSGFISGINTLDFFVFNDTDGPTALRVEIAGTADVPEPATLALVGLSLAALGWSRKKKQ